MSWETAVIMGTAIVPLTLLWLSYNLEGSTVYLKTLFWFSGLFYLDGLLFVTMKIAELNNAAIQAVITILFSVFTTLLSGLFVWFVLFMIIDFIKKGFLIKGK